MLMQETIMARLHFEFSIDDDLRGGFDMEYVNHELQIIERETGYIRLFDNGHIGLTAQGRAHCNNPDEAF
jgi:hypothetical protein